ncbi:MAG: Na/Pi cotransporter family protein [Halioglobus sp.]|nr:Na/Pi cotransporter family protein [Halioglobus sp.]
MEHLHIFTAGLTAVILFIFGLQNFSKEVETLAGEKFRKALAKATDIPVVGLLIGAAVTAIIQSSSATSVIAIGLVNAGVLSFKNSIGIVFGSNIGTTVTAQLVAFKLTSFAPVLIVAGFFLSLVHSRYAIFGKSIFYFGFVFFSLNLISSSLQPLQNDPVLIGYLTQPQNPLYAILLGCLFTALVQSSSVTTGLAIIFTQQGLMGVENAIPLIMGANIGTSATALIAIFNMDIAAKKTALSHLLFNIGGVIVFLPLFLLFGQHLDRLGTSPAIVLANFHMAFNVLTGVLFIIFINPFARFIDLLLGQGKMDFERLAIPVVEREDRYENTRETMDKNIAPLLEFLQENYNLVTLSIESNYRNVFDASSKRIDYLNFIHDEYLGYFSNVVTTVTDEQQSREMLKIITLYDYLFQVHDSIEDLFTTKKVIDRYYIELGSDLILIVRKLSSATLELFDEIHSAMLENRPPNLSARVGELREAMDDANRDLLKLLAKSEREDAGILSNFVTFSRRLTDKLVNFAALAVAGGVNGKSPSERGSEQT